VLSKISHGPGQSTTQVDGGMHAGMLLLKCSVSSIGAFCVGAERVVGAEVSDKQSLVGCGLVMLCHPANL